MLFRSSVFLSANGLPNVILPSVINSTPSTFAPSLEEMGALVGLANARGLNQWDERLASGIELDDVEIDSPGEDASLNEWTMVFSSETKEKINEGRTFVPTSELIADPERWLPQEEQ